MNENTHNWSNNLTYHAARWHHPENLEQLQELVAGSATVKAIGTRHSFNTIADTTGDMISLAAWDDITLDRDARTVTVGAGVRYGTLCRMLDEAGFALHNLASLPHISVVGACATATHGSGVGNANLSTQVRALEIVRADGEIVTLARDKDDAFPGAVVGLGALGIVTRATLDIEPAYQMRQVVYRNLPFDQLDDNFDAIASAAYSLSLFTDWQAPRFNQVWQKHRDDARTCTMEPTWFGASRATRKMHPIDAVPAESCTPQEGSVGPWYDRLPHFRMEFTPSHGEELQTEYFVPRARAVDAIRALFEVREQIAPLLMITEVRTIARDDFWLSPCYQQDSVGLHFTWKSDWPQVQRVLPQIEAALAPFAPRPHWGKLFTLTADRIQPLYAQMPRFQALRDQHDPNRKFDNAFLRATIATK